MIANIRYLILWDIDDSLKRSLCISLVADNAVSHAHSVAKRKPTAFLDDHKVIMPCSSPIITMQNNSLSMERIVFDRWNAASSSYCSSKQLTGILDKKPLMVTRRLDHCSGPAAVMLQGGGEGPPTTARRGYQNNLLRMLEYLPIDGHHARRAVSPPGAAPRKPNRTHSSEDTTWLVQAIEIALEQQDTPCCS